MASKRGRPRSEIAQNAILSSALELLETKGPARLTIEAVAEMAGVGKPTIYRYWSNAQELSMAAIMARPSDSTEVSAPTNGLDGLRTQLKSVIAKFSSMAGKQASMLLATADPDSEISKGFRNQVILKSRTEGREILRDILGDGADAPYPIETLLDMIYGPIFYRLLTKHAPLEASLADDIVDMVEALIIHPDASNSNQP